MAEIILENVIYLYEWWNIADLAANMLTAVYVYMKFYDEESSRLEPILAFANLLCWIRVIGYFRVYKETRYLISMIIQVCKRTFAFLLIFLTFVLQSCIGLKAFRPELDYETAWTIGYRLAYADFRDEDPQSEDTHEERIFFFIMTLLIPLLLLNLLIALLGDVFDEVELTKEKEDVREKFMLILEISKFFKLCKRGKKEKKYFHICTKERQQTHVKDHIWAGKVKELMRSIEKLEGKSSDELKESNRKQTKELTEKIVKRMKELL